LQVLKTAFDRSSHIVYREFQIDGKKGTLIFLDGLVNMELIDSNVFSETVIPSLSSLSFSSGNEKRILNLLLSPYSGQ
jgi:hypothetical protein